MSGCQSQVGSAWLRCARLVTRAPRNVERFASTRTARRVLHASAMAIVTRWERLATFARARRGAIMTEYLILVGLCGIVISTGVVFLGSELATAFYENRSLLLRPVP